MEAYTLFDDDTAGSLDWPDAPLLDWTCPDQTVGAGGDSRWSGTSDTWPQTRNETPSPAAGPGVVSTSRAPPQRDFRPRSSLACTACRSRHGRCDGRRPTCSQCRQLGRSCSYMPSRRARKPLVRDDRGVYTPQDVAESAAQQNALASSGAIQSAALATSDPGVSSTLHQPCFLDAYFAHFHRAHPFVLPRHEFYRRSSANETDLRQLTIIMDFIGSRYSDEDASSHICRRRKAEEALRPDRLPSNGFSLQAVLLFAIAMQSSREFDVAKAKLDQAVNLALRLGMHDEAYAQEHSDGDPVLAESWRRTWWSLYVVSAIFAAIRYDVHFVLYDVACTTALPCDEADYERGDIPSPRTLHEYRNREFLPDQQMAFSSFAYLIDIAHALGLVLGLALDTREALEPDVLDAEARMMSWFTYLPESKRLLKQTPTGQSDEVIFWAHVVFSA